jgi:hypothetical protein
MTGDLSDDQTAYAQGIVDRTGLNPYVVWAWVGTASGWGTYRHGHDYLTPGRPFQSTRQAVRGVAHRITEGPLRAVLPQGPLAQIQAIGDDPAWPATAAQLVTAWAELGARALASTGADR